jgi:hypothetical protein
MTTYYLDPAADFIDRSGADKAGNEYTGPGGMQAAMRGTGSATALAADDTLVIKAGTMAIDRLILVDCSGVDVSAWEVGDVVRNQDGAGDDWTGVVIQERDLDATGLDDDDMLLMQLDSPYTHADIDINDGIENTTKAESADPLVSATINPVYFDGIDGGSTTPINIIGCSADWTEKGSTNGTIIDGSVGTNTAANLWDVSGSNYWHIWNITFQNSSSDPLVATGNVLYWSFIHCKWDSITGGIVPGTNNQLYYATIYQCIFRNISGYVNLDTSAYLLMSLVEDCSGTYGLSMSTSAIVWNTLLAGNTEYISLTSYGGLVNCVVDGNDSGGTGQATDDLVICASANARVLCSRLVNAPATFYALDARASTLEDYNVFYNPSAAGDILSALEVGNSVGTVNSGETGMDAHWNIQRGKHHSSTPVVLNWDE